MLRATLLAFLALPSMAGAFEINQGPAGDLYWDQSLVFRDSDGRIPYWIQYQGSEELSFVQRDVLRRGFLAWAEAPNADLHFFEQRVDLREPEFLPGNEFDADKKALLFYVEDGWEYDEFVIGLTLVTFDSTGRIIDADIGFNAEDYAFSMNDDPPDVDLLSVAAHEIGHFLGIGHSEFEDATMFATYLGGIDARSLHEDDVAAIEYLYPCEDTCRSIVDWRPRADRGCSADPSDTAPWLAALAVLGVAAGLRRRRLGRGAATLSALVLTTSLGAPALVPPAESTLVERVDVDRMALVSDRVVRATVRSVEAHARGHVWSRVTLDVREDLSGTGDDVVVINQPGGLLDAPAPSGALGTVAMGFPQFDEGEEVVVFIADRSAGTQVVGLAQGKLAVLSDGSLERDLSGLALTAVGSSRVPVFAEMPSTLDALRAALRGDR